MTLAAVLIAALSLGLSAAAFAFGLSARADARATRSELSRHRHSHTVQQPDAPARRHGERPGPPPVADEHAAPPTAEIGGLLPPGSRPRVREDPQA